MSVLAKTTLPYSGLSRSSGSGLMPLRLESLDNHYDKEVHHLPNKSVDFFYRVLDFVEGISRLDP